MERRRGPKPGGLASISLLLCGIFLVPGAVADDPYVVVVLLCVCFV
jgi:hypothetical protein